jgi:hypothetical protein
MEKESKDEGEVDLRNVYIGATLDHPAASAKQALLGVGLHAANSGTSYPQRSEL